MDYQILDKVSEQPGTQENAIDQERPQSVESPQNGDQIECDESIIPSENNSEGAKPQKIVAEDSQKDASFDHNEKENSQMRKDHYEMMREHRNMMNEHREMMKEHREMMREHREMMREHRETMKQSNDTIVGLLNTIAQQNAQMLRIEQRRQNRSRSRSSIYERNDVHNRRYRR